MEKAGEAIISLRPVTFHYKTDAKGTPGFGLIAEEVAKVIQHWSCPIRKETSHRPLRGSKPDVAQ
jgi:hypothetical protein